MKVIELFMLPTQPPNDAPLPHLTGPPPVTDATKRGRIALRLSLAGWVAFVLSVPLIVSVYSISTGAPIAKGLAALAAGIVGVLLFGISPLLGIAAMVRSFPVLKSGLGKAAFMLGLLNLLVSLVIIGLGTL